MTAESAIAGREHRAHKGGIRLFLWERAAATSPAPRGTILFVHGSSMASTPTFDLQVPGRPDSSAMHYFASFRQKNYRIPYAVRHAFFSQPAPVYRGE